MTRKPKRVLPCAKCKTDEHLAIYEYERGGIRVECTKCDRMTEPYKTEAQAIKAHNANARE
ncbi:MAG: hypothetical protein EBR82_41715 [Caulobacteraceae bacterium]|nr:hypothetical protein [Caulobacteraceae bacterium]